MSEINKKDFDFIAALNTLIKYKLFMFLSLIFIFSILIYLYSIMLPGTDNNQSIRKVSHDYYIDMYLNLKKLQVIQNKIKDIKGKVEHFSGRGNVLPQITNNDAYIVVFENFDSFVNDNMIGTKKKFKSFEISQPNVKNKTSFKVVFRECHEKDSCINQINNSIDEVSKQSVNILYERIIDNFKLLNDIISYDLKFYQNFSQSYKLQYKDQISMDRLKFSEIYIDNIQTSDLFSSSSLYDDIYSWGRIRVKEIKLNTRDEYWLIFALPVVFKLIIIFIVIFSILIMAVLTYDNVRTHNSKIKK